VPPGTFTVHGRASRAEELAVRAVSIYQHLTTRLPSTCRYYPSCSQYAIQALRRDGFWKGSGLTLRRIARCTPAFPRGYDPLP
jgi:uncharacterized protein